MPTHRKATVVAVFLALSGLSACTPGVEAPDAGGGDGGHLVPASLGECAALDGGVMTSIADVVEHLDSLPHPVSGPCLVASLRRPLAVVATLESNSAQPSGGPHDPRLFLLSPGVVMAVVSSGSGARLLELAEWVSPTTTLKGEIPLPVTGALVAAAPFAHLDERKSGAVTTCGLCHTNESPHPSVPLGYVSTAFRPKTEVTLEGLAAEHDACSARQDASARCAMFHALFDFGPLEQGAFSPEVPTFGG